MTDRRKPMPRQRISDESGAAMLISLLTILVATALSIAVLGSVVSQLGPAQFGMKNTRTAHAAEAGLDTALGRIRTAVSVDPADASKVIGDRRLLPCDAGTSRGRLNGQVAGSPGDLQYAVTITYFLEDPAPQNATWRTANALQCAASGGPAVTPVFAVVSSAGTGTGVGRAAGPTAASRTLETVYDLQVTNANVLGGLIHTYFDGDAATNDLCFDAGSDAPVEGASLTVQSCSPGSARQLFSWRPDYSIVLSVSQGNSSTLGMCITAPVGGGSATLRTCNGTFTQKWGYTDSGGFAGQLNYNPPASSSTTNFCLYTVTDNTAGSLVSAASSWCTGYNRRSTWRPEARAGAGRAGTTSGPVENIPMQWVNFAEFGRCYDVTNWTVTFSFMIAYPCKQEPTGYVGWNQTMVWTGTAGTQQLYTVQGSSGQSYGQSVAAGGARYCATAPTTNGGYVLMSVCDSAQVRQRWTVNRDTGSFATGYTVVDSYGRCMAVGAPNMTQGVALQQWSTIVSETCNGSSRQKWNAPPTLSPSGLRDTAELVD